MPTLTWIMTDGPGWGWGHHMDGWGWAGMMLGWLVILLVVALIVAVTVFALRSRDGGGRRSHALDVLEERYARGEIDRDEYQRRKADLIG